jgi:hypothetical protein
LSAVLGALALALPVAWAHMWTRRFRYDPSLVQAIIVLPIVVAGVVLVVRNSLALAFALAGIVAGVRFRQKLNEPQDAVYVLLALGIGLAAGVQALDVALVISLIFNLVVLALWRWDVGGLEPGAAGTLLYAGDVGVLAPVGSVDRQEVEERALAGADGMRTDGILVVHAADPEAARRTLEVAVARVARDWKVTKPIAAGNGRSRFEMLVRLRRDADPADLMAEVRDRWTDRITAAEYIPFRLPGGDE